MRDRYVRGVFLGLIVAFPFLIAWQSPPLPTVASRGFAAYAPLLGEEAILVLGLCAAAGARRRLLAAGRGIETAEAEGSLSHITRPNVYAPSPSLFEGAAR